MLHRTLAVLALVTVCVAFGVPDVAFAQSGKMGEAESDEEAFARLLNEAKADREAGRYDAALEKLLKAYNLYPDPTLLFNVAKLYQDQDDCENAMAYFQRAAELADSSGMSKDKINDSLDRELGKFACSSGDEDTARVLADGLTTIKSARGWAHFAEISVKLGRCKEGRDAWLKTNELAPEGSVVSQKAVAALKDFQCTEANSTAGVGNGKGNDGKGNGEQATEDGISALEWTSYGLMVAAVGTLVGAIVVDLDTLDTINQYEEAADMGQTERFDALRDEAESGQTTTLILYVVSGVLGAGGVTLWALTLGDGESNEGASPSPGAVQLRPTTTLGPRSVGATFTVPLP